MCRNLPQDQRAHLKIEASAIAGEKERKREREISKEHKSDMCINSLAKKRSKVSTRHARHAQYQYCHPWHPVLTFCNGSFQLPRATQKVDTRFGLGFRVYGFRLGFRGTRFLFLCISTLYPSASTLQEAVDPWAYHIHICV